MDFMLSKEAQELMSSIDFTIPVNPEAKGVNGSVAIESLDLPHGKYRRYQGPVQERIDKDFLGFPRIS